jgi:4-hydroxy-4-methyl-2-oxoglutarate aldolase
LTHPLVLGVDDWLSLGASTVYEASGLPCALSPALRPVWEGARLCGPALTVRCAPGDNLGIHRAVELASPGSVLVVDAGGVLVGYWGEVLTRAARKQGVAGLVIDGAVRDIDALESLQFPVFARGVSMLATTKAHPGSIGEAIVVEGTLVENGSLVLADRDGVLAVPVAEIEQTAASARARQEKERGYFGRIDAGESTLDIYGWRETASSVAPRTADKGSGGSPSRPSATTLSGRS